MIRHKQFLMAALLVLALALSACQAGASAAPQPLQTVTVTRGTITATVLAAGTVNGQVQANVQFQTTGQVKTINVQVGDHVKAGQVMASLDAASLEAAVQSAQAGLAIAQAKLEQTKQGPLPSQVQAAQASVASAAAAYQAAQAKTNNLPDQLTVDASNLNNASQALSDVQGAYNNLLEYGGLKAAAAPWSSQKSALDTATINYNVALANYQLDRADINDSTIKSAAAQLASAQAQLADLKNTPTQQSLQLAQESVQQAQVSLDQAKANLRQAQLVAPFDGTVASLNIEMGEPVTASTPAVELVDLSRLETQVTVSEFDAPTIKVGEAAQITFDALPNQTYPGHVIAVGLAGQTTQGVVNFPVTVAFDQPGEGSPVRPGMNANVTIVTVQHDNVLFVPNQAIKQVGRQKTVTVLVNGKEQTVNVTMGLSNNTESEVTSGLKEGDVIVIPQTTTTTPRGFEPGGFGR